MSKLSKIAVSAYSKRVAARLHKQMINDTAPVVTHDVVRNNVGDPVAFCDWRVTCTARLLESDYAILLAAVPAPGYLDGLRVGMLVGLAKGPDHGAGNVYACFANGRRVAFLREKRTAVTDPTERGARELAYARIHREATPPARAKKLSRGQIEARRRGGEARAVLSDDVQSKIRRLYDEMSKECSHSWRCGQVALRASKQNLKRIDGDPITKRNASDCIARLSKPD